MFFVAVKQQHHSKRSMCVCVLEGGGVVNVVRGPPCPATQHMTCLGIRRLNREGSGEEGMVNAPSVYSVWSTFVYLRFLQHVYTNLRVCVYVCIRCIHR